MPGRAAISSWCSPRRPAGTGTAPVSTTSRTGAGVEVDDGEEALDRLGVEVRAGWARRSRAPSSAARPASSAVPKAPAVSGRQKACSRGEAAGLQALGHAAGRRARGHRPQELLEEKHGLARRPAPRRAPCVRRCRRGPRSVPAAVLTLTAAWRGSGSPGFQARTSALSGSLSSIEREAGGVVDLAVGLEDLDRRRTISAGRQAVERVCAARPAGNPAASAAAMVSVAWMQLMLSPPFRRHPARKAPASAAV